MQLYVLLSTNLYFISFLYLNLYVLRWYIDTLGIFHANQTSICRESYQNYGWGWYRQTSLNRTVLFLLTFLLWIFFVNCVLRVSVLLSIILTCLFLAAVWSPAGKELTSWFSCVWWFLVFLSHSHMVTWVRCDIWNYRFLNFAIFLLCYSSWNVPKLMIYL